MMYASSGKPSWGMAVPSVIRNLDRIAVRVVDVDRLDRADRAGTRALHSHRHTALLEMRRDLADRRLGDKADMRRHPLVAGHSHRASRGIEVDLLLTEQQRRAPFAD